MFFCSEGWNSKKRITNLTGLLWTYPKLNGCSTVYNKCLICFTLSCLFSQFCKGLKCRMFWMWILEKVTLYAHIVFCDHTPLLIEEKRSRVWVAFCSTFSSFLILSYNVPTLLTLLLLRLPAQLHWIEVNMTGYQGRLYQTSFMIMTVAVSQFRGSIFRRTRSTKVWPT